jgi:molybdopterin converting factor subunit 1
MKAESAPKPDDAIPGPPGAGPNVVRRPSSVVLPVLFFAAARDLAGADSAAVELPPGAVVADLRAELARRFPALAALLARSAVAVNHDFADDARPLAAADEVAVIPPVSGG